MERWNEEEISQYCLEYQDFLSSLKDCVWGKFVSRAHFRDVTRLQYCSIESRCSGTIFVYADGTQEVLGRWFEDEEAPLGKVKQHEFDLNSKTSGLQFILSDKKKVDYVEEIKPILSNIPVSKRRTVYVNIGDVVVWAFSYLVDIITTEHP